MKNIDHVYLETSKRLNIPVDTIRRVYSFFYKNGFYNKVIQGEGISFYMAKFGTFRYSYVKVNQQIINLIRRIRVWRVSEQYTEEKRQKILTELNERLQMCFKIRKQLQEESKDYFNGNISRLLKSPTRRDKELEKYSTKPKNRDQEQVG